MSVRNVPSAPERRGDVLVEETVPNPLPDSGGQVVVAVVQDRGSGAVGLGEEIEKPVDVLARHVHDGKENRRPRKIREEPVRVRGSRGIAGADRASLPEEVLRSARPIDQALGSERDFALVLPEGASGSTCPGR